LTQRHNKKCLFAPVASPYRKGPFLEERVLSCNNFIRGKSYVLLWCGYNTREGEQKENPLVLL